MHAARTRLAYLATLFAIACDEKPVAT